MFNNASRQLECLNLDFRLRIGSQTMRAGNRLGAVSSARSSWDPSAKRSYKAVEGSKREGEANSKKSSIEIVVLAIEPAGGPRLVTQS
jgi:hypothetical protein